MLYALMLPSGNDAALVLADALGKYCKGGGNGYKENKKAFIR
jgi:D-alanyl-D-alanine carboxypeptidase